MLIISVVVSNTDQGTNQKKQKSGTGREYEKKSGMRFSKMKKIVNSRPVGKSGTHCVLSAASSYRDELGYAVASAHPTF